VLHVRLNRPAKRNSVSDELLAQLHTVWVNLPSGIRAAVLSGEGQHFCAGLDLTEVTERNVAEGMQHSRAWHACFDAIQYGPVPVIAVLHGAVVGGGLELASAAHLRVAEDSAFYGLPEGTRGIFVGGGGSVRISRLIGVARMTDMMLTGRVFDADEGQAIAISNYRVADGAGWARRWNWATGSRATRRCPTTPSRRPCPALPTCRPATACSWNR
jgi:enoyl-CoA hydratase/carnithine racemase